MGETVDVLVVGECLHYYFCCRLTELTVSWSIRKW